MRASQRDTIDKLWTSVQQLSKDVNRLQRIIENLGLERIKTIRVELKLANHDRGVLQKELTELHKLLNEEIKDMKPIISANQHGRKLIGP